MKGNMPTVPVTDMLVHPREHDLVVATYGRGLYVVERRLAGRKRRRARWTSRRTSSPSAPRQVPGEGAWGNFEFYGDRQLIVPNDEELTFDFFLKEKPAGKVKVTVTNAAGSTVRTIEAEAQPGMNRVSWDMRVGRGAFAGPGDYTVTVEAGDRKLTQKARILPRHP